MALNNPKSLRLQSLSKVRKVYRANVQYAKQDLPRQLYQELLESYFLLDDVFDDFLPKLLTKQSTDQDFVDQLRSLHMADAFCNTVNVNVKFYQRETLNMWSNLVEQHMNHARFDIKSMKERICERCWETPRTAIIIKNSWKNISGWNAWKKTQKRRYYCSVCTTQPLYEITKA